MVNKKFEAYKIKREIKRSGIAFEFKRSKKNNFNESIKEFEIIGKFNGLYHEQNSTISISTNDATQVRSKKIPMILCLYEDTVSLVLQVGDFVTINSRTFKVTGITNIQGWNIISDISLEVVDSGVPA